MTTTQHESATIDSGPPARRPSASRVAADRVGVQLHDGGRRLAAGASRFGAPGLWARAAMLRALRHVIVRQGLVDERLAAVVSSLAFDTSVASAAASSFPQPLAPRDVVDVTTKVGELYLHAADRVMTPAIVRDREWEMSEAAFMTRTLAPGQTLIDVGANVGYFSVLGASLVGAAGRVIAVEPEPRNLALLKANLWRNGAGNAIVLPVAAGAAHGFVSLRLNETNRGDHQTGVGEPDALVPCARLDDLVDDRRIDFVKIDTQGLDHEVITGLTRTLARDRSTVMCEFWPEGMHERGIDPRAVADQYAGTGCAMYLLDEAAALHPIGPDALVEAAIAHEVGYVNVVLRSDAS
jgi:FkbM family methyltransferase